MKTLVFLFVIAAYSTSALAGGTFTRPLPQRNAPRAVKTQIRACDGALAACEELVSAQDASILNLKKQLKDTQDALADSDPGTSSLLIGIIGFIAGAALTGILVR